jgi:hypothetical protein
MQVSIMNDCLMNIETFIDLIISFLPPELLALVPPLDTLLAHPDGRYILVGIVAVILLLALWVALRLMQILLGKNSADDRMQAAIEAVTPPDLDNKKPRAKEQHDNATNANNFQFFRRGKKTKADKEEMALSAIEQEMLAVRQLFSDGHIVKDVYVAETRRLYNKAELLKV